MRPVSDARLGEISLKNGAHGGCEHGIADGSGVEYDNMFGAFHLYLLWFTGLSRNINYYYVSMNEEDIYVLGWPQASGKIAILCRSRGNNPGPAYCWSKREAIQLRTRLANDQRGEKNPSARRIIRQLLVYRYRTTRNLLPWRPGDLWVYADELQLEACEMRHMA